MVAVPPILRINLDQTEWTIASKFKVGKRINSKVIRSGCYSFMVHSHPDSSTISGRDLSCLKIISQVSWLKWTSKEAGLRYVSLQGAKDCPGAALCGTDAATRGEVLAQRVQKMILRSSWHHTSTKTITESKQVSLIFKKQNVYVICNYNSVHILWQGLTYEGHFTDSSFFKAFLSHSELHFYLFSF